MALTNAQRQKRYREKRKAQSPVICYRRPKENRSRVQRWADAVEELCELQSAYQEWLDNLPENLQDSVVAEKLEAVCDLDLDELDIELPLGFGRD